MTDVRADDTLEEGDRLPWLEAVEEEERGPSPIKLIAAVLLGLVAIGIVVGGLFWLGNRGGTADEELIASPGEYKVRPPEAGGMRVDNSSATQVATSEGAEPQGRINQNAAPETPVTQPQPAPRTQPAPRPVPQQQAQRPTQVPAQPSQARPQPQQPRPQPQAQAQAQPRPTGPTIQVGAYPSEAAANGEWARLTQRYPYLGSLQRSVTVYQRGNQTFYRLRASGSEASAVCRRLRASRQPCMDVN